MTSLDPTMSNIAGKLVDWYRLQRRSLPWRENRDPYRIWISEIMLQQTTVQAVIPYYERFLTEFPDLESLARAPLSEVLRLWTGLGYYSRARNLHAAAQKLAKTGFPRTAHELETYPGFGPYTARAVASLAFLEPVGVLDGNAVRVLSRLKGWPVEHWKSAGRKKLQCLSDELAREGPPDLVNQGLMELGATLCTPRSPQCFLCPWLADCEARKEGNQESLPLPKPRREMEIWEWYPRILTHGGSVALVRNDYAPFLKGQWLFPGEVKSRAKKPKQFDLRHGITHHDIYVRLPRTGVDESSRSRRKAAPRRVTKGIQWVPIDKLTEWNPSNLLRKVLAVRGDA